MNLKYRGIEGRIVVLRNKGFSFRKIAEKVGFESPTSVMRIYKKCKLKR